MDCCEKLKKVVDVSHLNMTTPRMAERGDKQASRSLVGCAQCMRSCEGAKAQR